MIKFYPSVFNGTIEAPASKDHAQRLLFAAALSSVPTLVKNVPASRDIDTTLDCLEALGCAVEKSGGARAEVLIKPFVKTNPLQHVDFNFRQSATTARLATAIAAVMGITAECRASGTLPARAQVPLTGRMALRGVTFSNFSYPLSIQGRLRGGSYEFDGDEASQFLSALLMALPLAAEDSTIKLTSPITDRTGIDLTVSVLNSFGVRIEEREGEILIPGRQVYESPGEISAGNDWALAALWVCAGSASSAGGGRIEVTGLPDTDSVMYKDLAPVFSIISQDFKKVNIDASRCPDLVTVFSALACAKKAEISITGVPRTRFDENNRFRHIGRCLQALGAGFSAEDDTVTVRGDAAAASAETAVLDCDGDPWLFMSLAIASCSFDRPITISDEHCAEKVYAGFLDDFASLGGKYEIE